MNANEERLMEIRKDAIELIEKSAKNQLEQLDTLIEQHGKTLLEGDAASGGPMAMPKNIVTAMMIREAWQWGPAGCRIQISTSSGAGVVSKRARSFIDRIRGMLK